MSPEDNTKIERVVEAVEDFANAIIDGRVTDTDANQAEVDRVTQGVLAARATLADTLRAFLQPRLTIIQGGRQPNTLGADGPICAACNQQHKCEDNLCPHWHDAVSGKAKRVADAARKVTPIRRKGLRPDDEPPRRA